jgi:alanyl-tRNA synthetase
MTSAQIRQSFLDFFREKQHTIVPSASLLPDSPNLLFTNAGMNQFVPIFLGQEKPSWNPPRVADTQKCVRAGGKHNDLDDVGLDTYHHTFFEMLGNWSFGDYFKKEAIEWAWELVIERWKLPPQRLYATVYCPHMHIERWLRELRPLIEIAKSRPRILWEDERPGDSNSIDRSDRESIQYWAALFHSVGINPEEHIIPGSRKDNFWMMGDTGPCGPCSELHIDLTPAGDTKGALVNAGDPRCIEIWNLVFIQFNADADGMFSPLPQRHVDTGMGFERITAMIQGTKNFANFSRPISNYETDIFQSIFDEIEKLSGKKYGSTLPIAGQASRLPDKEEGSRSGRPTSDPEQEKIDVAFRVIADHIRTLSFAIADGIQPSNEGRGYVLRRILRRAVRYGRTLGFHEPFFYRLVDIVARTMGDVFPEIRAKRTQVNETIKREEDAFNKTLDTGITLFNFIGNAHEKLTKLYTALYLSLPRMESLLRSTKPGDDSNKHPLLTAEFEKFHGLASEMSMFGDFSGDVLLNEWVQTVQALPPKINNDLLVPGLNEEYYREHRAKADSYIEILERQRPLVQQRCRTVSSFAAFRLYDTYGFPIDLTELMARERGFTVDVTGFEKLMEEQRERARSDHKKKKAIITTTERLHFKPTKFLGFDFLESEAVVEAIDVQTTPVSSSSSSGPDILIRQSDGSVVIIECKIITDRTPFYAEMGGQVGDAGVIHVPGRDWSEVGRLAVFDTQKDGDVFVHRARLLEGRAPEAGEAVRIAVDAKRRGAIQRHHTATHLLHWALHEIVARSATQEGSRVGPEKLTFDFSSAALTPQQRREVEMLVNEKVAANSQVSWTEVAYAEAKKRSDIHQFFGDKYGEQVRVVQIGGEPEQLDGYSMELCGGTHVRATGDIGPFRIVREEAIAAGIRRIEAVAGDAARDWAKQEAGRQQEKFEALARKKAGIAVLPSFAENAETSAMLEQIDARSAHLEKLEAEVHEWEKQHAKAAETDLRSRAGIIANELAAAHAGEKSCVGEVPNADAKLLQAVVDVLKPKFSGPIFLAGATDGRVALIASVPKELTSRLQANKLIQEVAPIVGGKGGGRPEGAQGAGKDATKISETLTRVRELISL